MDFRIRTILAKYEYVFWGKGLIGKNSKLPKLRASP